MKNMKHFIILCLLLIIPSAVNAQLISIPAQTPVGAKLIASIDNAPTGTLLWNASPELQTEQVENRLFIWGQPGTYSVNCILIPLKQITVQDQTFDVIAGPIQRLDAQFRIVGTVPPAPKPDEEDDPEPPPSSAPFPAPGLSVIILREAQEAHLLPPAQRSIFNSAKVIGWCTQNCTKLNGQPAFRIWDDDYTRPMFANAPAVLTDAYFLLLEQATTRPWIAISDGKRGFSGPLPGTVDETLALLQKFAP